VNTALQTSLEQGA